MQCISRQEGLQGPFPFDLPRNSPLPNVSNAYSHGEAKRWGQDMDEQGIRPRYRTTAYDGYLSLPLAAAYLWRSRRGLRGRLSQIVYYRPDGRQILFKKADSGACRETFRVDPVGLDAPGEKKKKKKK